MKKIYFLLLHIIYITYCCGQNNTSSEFVQADNDSTSVLKNSSSGEMQFNNSLAEKYYLSALGKPKLSGPGGFVRSMLQDKAGNIWFGTWDGIYLFDGKSFINFSSEKGLNSDPVFSILEDKQGNIWFGSRNWGAICYDGKTLTNLTKSDGLIDNFVNSILQDKKGNLWFGTDGGVSCYNGKSFTNFITKDRLIHNSVYTMLEATNGNIWLGTEGGVYIYNSGKNSKAGEEKMIAEFKNLGGLPFRNVRSLMEDKNGKIWIGSPDGVCCFDGNNYTNYSKKDGLKQNFVWSILKDKKNNLWFGVCDINGYGAGISRFDVRLIDKTRQAQLNDLIGKDHMNAKVRQIKSISNKEIRFTNFTEKDGLIDNRVFCILEDKEGNIWFGTSNGVSRYNGNKFTNFTATGYGC